RGRRARRAARRREGDPRRRDHRARRAAGRRVRHRGDRGAPARRDRRGNGRQAALRVHPAARRADGPPRLPAAVRVHGAARQGLDARAPRAPAGRAVTDPGTAPVEGVLFDVDDTLVDTRAAFAAAIAAASRVWLPHLPQDRYDEVLALWRADPNGHYRAYTRGEVDFDAQRMARANELQATFGGELLDDAAYVDWKDLFWGTFEAS